jgi:hypothetical protein
MARKQLADADGQIFSVDEEEVEAAKGAYGLTDATPEQLTAFQAGPAPKSPDAGVDRLLEVKPTPGRVQLINPTTREVFSVDEAEAEKAQAIHGLTVATPEDLKQYTLQQRYGQETLGNKIDVTVEQWAATGAELVEAASKAGFGQQFNPITGQPIGPSRLDPLTGKPRPGVAIEAETVAPFAYTPTAKAKRAANPNTAAGAVVALDLATALLIPQAGVIGAIGSAGLSAAISEAGASAIDEDEFSASDMGIAFGASLALEGIGAAVISRALRTPGARPGSVQGHLDAAVERARVLGAEDAIDETDPAALVNKLRRNDEAIYEKVQTEFDGAMSKIDERLVSDPDTLFTPQALKKTVSGNVRAQEDGFLDLAVQLDNAAQVLDNPAVGDARDALKDALGKKGADLYAALHTAKRNLEALGSESPLVREAIESLDGSLRSERTWGKAARTYADTVDDGATVIGSWDVREIAQREALDARLERARTRATATGDVDLMKQVRKAERALERADKVTGARLIAATTPDDVAALKKKIEGFEKRGPKLAKELGKNVRKLQKRLGDETVRASDDDALDYIAARVHGLGGGKGKDPIRDLLRQAENHVQQLKTKGASHLEIGRAQAEINAVRAAADEVNDIPKAAKRVRQWESHPSRLKEKAVNEANAVATDEIENALQPAMHGGGAAIGGALFGVPGYIGGYLLGRAANKQFGAKISRYLWNKAKTNVASGAIKSPGTAVTGVLGAAAGMAMSGPKLATVGYFAGRKAGELAGNAGRTLFRRAKKAAGEVADDVTRATPTGKPPAPPTPPPAPGAPPTGGGAIGRAGEAAVDAARATTEAAKQTAGAVGAAVQNATRAAVARAERGLEVLSGAVNDVAAAAASAAKKTAATAEDVAKAAAEAAKGASKSAGKAGAAGADAVADAARQAAAKASATAADVAKATKDAAGAAVEGAKAAVARSGSAIGNAHKAGLAAVENGAGTILERAHRAGMEAVEAARADLLEVPPSSGFFEKGPPSGPPSSDVRGLAPSSAPAPASGRFTPAGPEGVLSRAQNAAKDAVARVKARRGVSPFEEYQRRVDWLNEAAQRSGRAGETAKRQLDALLQQGPPARNMLEVSRDEGQRVVDSVKKRLRKQQAKAAPTTPEGVTVTRSGHDRPKTDAQLAYWAKRDAKDPAAAARVAARHAEEAGNTAAVQKLNDAQAALAAAEKAGDVEATSAAKKALLALVAAVQKDPGRALGAVLGAGGVAAAANQDTQTEGAAAASAGLLLLFLPRGLGIRAAREALSDAVTRTMARVPRQEVERIARAINIQDAGLRQLLRRGVAEDWDADTVLRHQLQAVTEEFEARHVERLAEIEGAQEYVRAELWRTNADLIEQEPQLRRLYDEALGEASARDAYNARVAREEAGGAAPLSDAALQRADAISAMQPEALLREVVNAVQRLPEADRLALRDVMQSSRGNFEAMARVFVEGRPDPTGRVFRTADELVSAQRAMLLGRANEANLSDAAISVARMELTRLNNEVRDRLIDASHAAREAAPSSAPRDARAVLMDRTSELGGGSLARANLDAMRTAQALPPEGRQVLRELFVSVGDDLRELTRRFVSEDPVAANNGLNTVSALHQEQMRVIGAHIARSGLTVPDELAQAANDAIIAEVHRFNADYAATVRQALPGAEGRAARLSAPGDRVGAVRSRRHDAGTLPSDDELLARHFGTPDELSGAVRGSGAPASARRNMDEELIALREQGLFTGPELQQVRSALQDAHTELRAMQRSHELGEPHVSSDSGSLVFVDSPEQLAAAQRRVIREHLAGEWGLAVDRVNIRDLEPAIEAELRRIADTSEMGTPITSGGRQPSAITSGNSEWRRARRAEFEEPDWHAIRSAVDDSRVALNREGWRRPQFERLDMALDDAQGDVYAELRGYMDTRDGDMTDLLALQRDTVRRALAGNGGPRANVEDAVLDAAIDAHLRHQNATMAEEMASNMSARGDGRSWHQVQRDRRAAERVHRQDHGQLKNPDPEIDPLPARVDGIASQAALRLDEALQPELERLQRAWEESPSYDEADMFSRQRLGDVDELARQFARDNPGLISEEDALAYATRRWEDIGTVEAEDWIRDGGFTRSNHVLPPIDRDAVFETMRDTVEDLADNGYSNTWENLSEALQRGGFDEREMERAERIWDSRESDLDEVWEQRSAPPSSAPDSDVPSSGSSGSSGYYGRGGNSDTTEVGLPSREDMRDAGMNSVSINNDSGIDRVFGRELSVDDMRGLFSLDHLKAYADEVGSSVHTSLEVNGSSVEFIGEVGRDFKIHTTYKQGYNGVEIYYNFLHIPQEMEGSGAAKKLLGDMLAPLESLGASQVTLSAAWVGQYAWLKLGARPSQYAERQLFDSFERALGQAIEPGMRGQAVRHIMGKIENSRDVADTWVPVDLVKDSLPELRLEWERLMQSYRASRVREMPFEEACFRTSRSGNEQFLAGKYFLLTHQGSWNSGLSLDIAPGTPWYDEFKGRLGLAGVGAIGLGVWELMGAFNGTEAVATGIGKPRDDAGDAPLPPEVQAYVDQQREESEKVEAVREKLGYVTSQGKTTLQTAARALTSRFGSDRVVSAVPGVTSSKGVASFLGTNSTLREAYEEKRETLELLARDPMALVNELTEGMADLQDTAPALHAQMVAQTYKIVQFLQGKLPATIGTSLARPKGAPPNDQALRQFALFYSAATEPATVLTDLANNRARREQVDTLREVWEPAYNELKAALVTEMANGRPTVARRQRLDLLFDFGDALDTGLSSRLMAIAAAQPPPQPGQGPQGQPSAPGKVPTRRTQPSVAGASATGSLSLGAARGLG